MPEDQIDWNQTRALYQGQETGEIYVKVETGFMLDTDYVEGGASVARFQIKEPLIQIGRFTNAQIDRAEYDLVAYDQVGRENFSGEVI